MKRLKVIKIMLVILAVFAFGYGLLGLDYGSVYAQGQKPTPVSQPTVEPDDKPTPPGQPTAEPTQKPDPPPAQPTQPPDKPGPKPTQTPEPMQAPEKPTVAPTKPVVDATPTPVPPDKPDAKPTPTSSAPLPGGPESPGPGKAPPEPTPLPGESGPVSSETPPVDGDEGGDEEKAQDALVVSVHVFDDRDRDAVRGVPVLLDGVVIGATDADGRFALSLDGHIHDRATLSIDPPSGWRWDGAPVDIPDVLATGRADFSLTREASSEHSPPRDTGASPGLATTLALLIALTFVGIGSLAQAGSARSLTVAYRRQMAQSLEWQQDEIIEQRRAEAEQALRDTGDWRGVLRQVLVDALPEVGAGDVSLEIGDAWLAVVDVGVSPARFAVARQTGEEGSDKRYTFTTLPRIPLINWWRKRVITLDAALSPSVRVEVEAVWRYLLQKREVDAVAVLPRRAEWYLVIERSWLKLLKSRIKRGE